MVATPGWWATEVVRLGARRAFDLYTPHPARLARVGNAVLLCFGREEPPACDLEDGVMVEGQRRRGVGGVPLDRGSIIGGDWLQLRRVNAGDVDHGDGPATRVAAG